MTVSSPGGLPAGGGAPCTHGRLTLQHAPVGRVGDCVDVGGHLVPLLALVHVDDLLRVDGQLLVGVHHHAEEARVRLPNRESILFPEPSRDESLDKQPVVSGHENTHHGLHCLSTTMCIFSLHPHSGSLRQMCSESHFRDGETEAQSPSGNLLASLTLDIGEEEQGARLDL